ncbi:Uncharacterised protein [uncultured archaeon]|nr:Uncharacterised protein [uncultured archaeon]
MRKSLMLAMFLVFMLVMQPRVNASFNVTYLTTSVTFTNSTTAHVVEMIDLHATDASVGQYQQYRQAFNLSLSDWQQGIGSSLMVQHIINPKSSISNFTFLPGPMSISGHDGYAVLTLNYYAKNVTSMAVIGPRKFQYAFNATSFSFMHTASGQSLFPNAKLVLTTPAGSSLISVYPAPDFPQPNKQGAYADSNNTFTWSSGEPLQKFTFVYVTTETPQQEVVNYFTSIYQGYSALIYAAAALILAAIIIYIYIKVAR